MHIRLRRAALLLGSVPALAFAAVSPAQAETPYAERASCLFDVVACAHAMDAAPWALGTAQALFPGMSLADDRGDAFRHCAWSGAIAQRVGSHRAENVTTRHEYFDPDRHDDLFGYASMGMDLANNATGHAIGDRANAEGGSDTWGWIIDECYAAAVSGELVTLR